MKLAQKTKCLAGRIKRRVSPLHGIVPAADYLAALTMNRFETGSARVLGREIKFSDQLGFRYSVHEIFVDEVYRFRAGTDSPRIIDAGANIGLSILYFKHLYPRCRVVAYEPDPAIFGLLSRNVGHYPDVTLRQSAAWIEDTELTFYSEGSLAGSTEVDFLNGGAIKEVKAERLRDELAREPVDFLKMDIEGAENTVLFDIEDQLPNIKLIFFEYHGIAGKTQLLGEMLNVVRNAGFRYVINGTHAPRLPFMDAARQGFDLQLNVSCWREQQGP